ncbi:MAG: hypothetical protein ACK5LJ_17755 [Paracoccus sp. (in: a-proteobacteria)]
MSKKEMPEWLLEKKKGIIIDYIDFIKNRDTEFLKIGDSIINIETFDYAFQKAYELMSERREY